MAVVPGKKREAGLLRSLRRSTDSATKYMTQRMCNQCQPHRWVRNRDWTDHRENFHTAGGYEYDKRKKQTADRAEAIKNAEAAAKKAAADPTPQRPATRPKSKAKTPQKKASPAVAKTNGATPWKSPVARKGAEPGEAGNQAAGATSSINDVIVESFRAWAVRTPPSIPAARADAQATSDMWRGAADQVRARGRHMQENDNIPAKVTEPLEAVAQLLSQIGDQHMEVVRRIETHYGEVADILARPDTPNADFLRHGR